MRMAVDTGGTFTDLVVEEDGCLNMFKAPTTPQDPVEGILQAVRIAAESMSLKVEELLNRAEMFIHGTTHAINAVITGNTAKTAFLTTEGHPDVLVWREGGRIEPFNFTIGFPKPYVSRALTFQIPERIAWDGQIQKLLDEEAVLQVIHQLKVLKVEAIAVCLLWSTINPTHEKKIGELIEKNLSGMPYTLSHQLNPILREYRRASSACIDASLKPLMSHYLGGLQARLTAAGFEGRLLMLTSKGGVMDLQDLAQAPIHAIGSGPSMAPIAGRYFAQADAETNTAIVADTGGTTYDVSLVRRGVIPMTPETWIGQRTRGHIVGFPSVDVKSIGAGGGSIAWVDEGGLLHVGPISAGAVPGPASYDKGGTRPTVTDASLVLGYIDPEFFLGGAMKLNIDRAKLAIEKEVSNPLNLDLHEAALAMMRLATENMVSAIEQITIHQGMDPRQAILIGAGGAAGLNSVAIAKQLGCPKVIIPEVGAALSALGALISELHADYRALYYTTTDHFDYDGVNATLDVITSKCKAFVDGPGSGSIESSIEIMAEARYKDQVWEIDVPLTISRFSTPEDVAKVRESFDQVHEELFAFKDPDSVVQFVGWRAIVRCRITDGEVGKLVDGQTYASQSLSQREAYFSDVGHVESQVRLLAAMKPGETVSGPAIIESPYTTIVVEPSSSAVLTKNGSLVVSTNSTSNELD